MTTQLTATWGATGISYSYGRKRALDNVTLTARPGQVTAVLGGDGAGKTTLLRCIAGAIAPVSGEVTRPAKDHIGYLPSGSGVYQDLTVTENLDFRASAYHMPRQEARTRAEFFLEETGLAQARDRLAGQLSGGMRQKLGVVAAMLHQPELLILDEPSTGVDPVSRAGLWWLIARAAAEGCAVVLATTSIDEADRCASALALDEGAVLANAIPEQWRNPPRISGRDRRQPRAAEALVQVTGAIKRFGDFTAVNNVSLEVGPGEIVGLLGANGAGKTTLIRMLLGLTSTTDGQVSLFGQAPSRQTRRRLGYVPQGLGLYDDLTTAENLSFTAAAFGSARALPDDVAPYADDLIDELPLGVQRRVAFAAALSHHPDLLILDEPTSGVDPRGRARLWDTIGATADRGAGVLVTTHYMEEAAECDRLVVMADGVVVAAGTTTEIIGDRQVTAVETDDWATAFGQLEHAGLQVALAGRSLRVPGAGPAKVTAALGDLKATVTQVPATLEERFFELVTQEQKAPVLTEGTRE
ncbi:MAG TPA: ATP-binding cassette domain-containing protein [Streptosporangiaceae bacterium]|nr:ATP-binding cassette domain-containing protein [Streptosporangiaceae bacterium]